MADRVNTMVSRIAEVRDMGLWADPDVIWVGESRAAPAWVRQAVSSGWLAWAGQGTVEFRLTDGWHRLIAARAARPVRPMGRPRAGVVSVVAYTISCPDCAACLALVEGGVPPKTLVCACGCTPAVPYGAIGRL
jgi:hypothetical protein